MASSWFVDVELDKQKRTDRRKRTVSFLDCLRKKYCGLGEDVSSYRFVTIVFHGKPKSTGDGELNYLRNVVLSGSRISVAGLEGQSLKSLCPNVVDLDLSDNLLTSWEEVLPVISQLESLKFLNLAGNDLKNTEDCLQLWDGGLPGVENLVLNRTGIPWTDVLSLASKLHNLKELHLCGNGYTDLPDTGMVGLKAVQCLRLNNNQIPSWCEIWKVRHLPCLTSLILSENPLQDVFFQSNDVNTCDIDYGGECVQCNGNNDVGKDSSQFSTVKDECKVAEHFKERDGKSTNDTSTDKRGDTDYCCDTSEDDTAEAIDEWCNTVIAGIIEKLEKENNGEYIPKTTHDGQAETGPDTVEYQDQTNAKYQCARTDIEGALPNAETPNSNNLERDTPLKSCQCKRSDNPPFSTLETLCLSETSLSKWKHLSAVRQFPALKSLRIKDIKLCSKLSQEDRRKLFVASLPNIKQLNGSEVSPTEREKAERHLLRHFCDKSKKPDIFHILENKHGKVEPLVDIDISRGYQEWVTLDFVYQGEVLFTETVSVRQPVGRLRQIIAEKMSLYASFKNIQMYHKLCNPCHQEKNYGEVPQQFDQLILDTLPMSRFDIMDGDEIHIDVNDSFTSGALEYIYLRNYITTKLFQISSNQS